MANPLAAALGPIGGLAACACCLIITAIWGIFATMIALAVYLKDWKDAINDVFIGNTSGASLVFSSQALLIGILCLYGYFGIRRALSSTI